MVIAFWNINNNTDIADLLIDFVKENEVDILLLAESEKKSNGSRATKVDDIILDFIIKTKKQTLVRDYKFIPNRDFRVKILSSFSPSCFKQKSYLFKSTRWTALYITIPNIIDINLFPVHFHSKVNWSDASQALECVNFSRDISLIENDTNCYNTILIGDFNMNPFESGIIGANGLNAVQDLNYAHSKPHGKDIDGTFYKYFYNPMWNHFGDKTLPYGTHYYRSSGHYSLDWNIFDQIIIRPQMKSYLKVDSFKIINTIFGKNLLNKNNRLNKNISDHLPILIDLNI
jgi:endonuclease/exonuclease/phosphatase family metal-dependent hydrolase